MKHCLQVLHSADGSHWLLLMGQPAQLVPSSAPLTGYQQAASSLSAMLLHDHQVLIRPEFDQFPTVEVTLELWMQSLDTCAPGVVFSYAAGSYGVLDNALLLFDYNNWCVGHDWTHDAVCLCLLISLRVWTNK